MQTIDVIAILKNSTLAIVPARAGSTRVKDKNLKPIDDKPLFLYSVESALLHIDPKNIVVSSDSMNILRLAEHAGVVAQYRPECYSTSTASTDSVLYYVLSAIPEAHRQSIQYILCFPPSNPVRYSDMIPRLMSQFIKENTNSIISVWRTHPFGFTKLDGKILPNYDTVDCPRTQDVPPYYHVNATLHGCKREYLEKTTVSVDYQSLSLYECSYAEAIDIDTVQDFREAETILSGKVKQNMGIQ